MGAAAAESGREAAWGRGCGEHRKSGGGPAYTTAADPEQEGRTLRAGGRALAQPVPPKEGQGDGRGLSPSKGI